MAPVSMLWMMLFVTLGLPMVDSGRCIKGTPLQARLRIRGFVSSVQRASFLNGLQIGGEGRRVGVRGIFDEADEDDMRSRMEKTKISRVATSKEAMQMRSRFAQKKQKSKLQRKKAGMADQEEEDDIGDSGGDANAENQGIDMKKYSIVYKRNGGRLAVPKKMLFRNNSEGIPQLQMGVFGKGEMHWYELWLSGKPSSIEKSFTEKFQTLPRAINPKTKRPILRECTIFCPSKRIRTYNPDTGRKGSKTLRFADGEKIFARFVLDNHAYRLIHEDKRIHGFVHCHKFNDQNLPFPMPARRLEEAEEWMHTDHNQDKDQILQELDGKLVDSANEEKTEAMRMAAAKQQLGEWDPFADVEELNI
ncbi:hypothetical protein AAMO2058_000927200 [Amorphochlora amoebiformis]